MTVLWDENALYAGSGGTDAFCQCSIDEWSEWWVISDGVYWQMTMSSELTLEVVYYNEQLAVCEPLIEPVEADIGHRPWQIAFSVSHYYR